MSRSRLSNPTLHAVDVFSGGGGLTLGLKQAGFVVSAAVEIEPHSFATYKTNHAEVHCFKQDVCTISGTDILTHVPGRQVALLAGCPPCQGFSSLTSKVRREDPRNVLVLQMARLAAELKPSAIMLENVPGLAIKGKPLLDELLLELDRLGYLHSVAVLQAADYGVPQFRRRLVLLAGKGFPIPIPPPTHSQMGKGGLKKWRTVRDCIGGMEPAMTLSQARPSLESGAFDWHVVREMSHANVNRIRFAKPGHSWRSIPRRLRPACHREPSTGFPNVYGRMKWDDIAPTITAGCTTLSKGRFGHPEMNRTISVREAALLQTFPRNYVLPTPYMEYACRIVGNALPCEFARILANACKEAIETASNVRVATALVSRVVKRSSR